MVIFRLRFYFLLFITLLSAQLSFAEIQISLQPTPVVAGEPANLTIRSTEGKASIVKLPDIPGLKWLQPDMHGSSIMIINGTRYETTTYSFTVKQTGLIKIPALKIKIKNEEYNTQSKSIRVISGPLTDLEKYIYIQPVYLNGDKKDVYAGEDIPLEIYVYKAINLSATPVEYPQVKLNGIIFNDFSRTNKENERFARYPYSSPAKVEIDGIPYIKTSFYTSFRPIIVGELKGSVSLLFDIKLPNQRRNPYAFHPSMSADDFFSNSFNSFFDGGRRISKMVVANLPELEVMPLPAVPENVNFLGLLGDWKTNVSLSTTKLKEGEPLTLRLELTGNGSLETLKTPELSIPGFTAYPPEVNKGTSFNVDNRNNTVTVNYVLIPTEHRKANINISFATFDPESGKYNISKLDKVVEVTENQYSTNGTVYSRDHTAISLNNLDERNNKVNNAILYLHKNIGSNVRIPLYRNNLWLTILFFIAGPLLWLLFILLRFRKLQINKDTSTKRRYRARKNYYRIIKAVRKSSPEKLNELVNNEVVPFINDIKGFPPGTTVDEITRRISNKELIDCLREIDTSRYIPGNDVTNDQMKNKLYKCIRKMSFLITIGIFLILSCPLKGASSSNSDINNMIRLYNSGHFKQAEQICRKHIIQDAPNPSWLYNLADCYFQSNDLPKALVYYERALLLAPRNSDILENLNYVRNKLFLPEKYTTNTPKGFLVYLRDLFRPDEWLLILSISCFLIFCGLITKYFLTRKFYVTLMFIGCIMSVVSLAAFINQNYTIYNNKHAVVLYRDIDVYSLPSVNSSKSELNLIPGEQIEIEETMNDWIRIRIKNSEGWIKSDNVERIWPY